MYRLLLLLLLPLITSGQDSVFTVATPIDTLIRILQRGATDEIRLQANLEFSRRIKVSLETDTLNLECVRMADNLSCVTAEGIRILTWTVPSYEGNQYRYFGFVQRRHPETGNLQLFFLRDSTSVIRKPESEKLTSDKWFGAAYYELIPRKKSGRTYYTLIGWKGKDRKVTQKVIDVLFFDGDQVRFGAPLFKKESVYRSRVVFSHTSQATMSLRYEPSKRMIIFDHLSGPKSPGSGTPDPSLSGPDGSYDGYRFRSGHWQWYGNLKMKAPSRSR